MHNYYCLINKIFLLLEAKQIPFFKNLSSFRIAIAFTTRRAASNRVPKLNTIVASTILSFTLFV